MRELTKQIDRTRDFFPRLDEMQCRVAEKNRDVANYVRTKLGEDREQAPAECAALLLSDVRRRLLGTTNESITRALSTADGGAHSVFPKSGSLSLALDAAAT